MGSPHSPGGDEVSPEKWIDQMTKALKSPSSDGRKKRRVRTLDDLVSAAGPGSGQSPSSPSKSMRLTSPRSLLACLHLGMDPEELVYRAFEDFAEHGIDRELQTLRFETHERKRREKLARLQVERNQIIQKDFEDAAQGGGGGHGGSLGATGPNSPTSRSPGKSTPHIFTILGSQDMVDKEAQRLQVLRRRQQRELEQMVNYETKRQAMTLEAQRKIQMLQQKEARERAERIHRDREWQEECRQREMHRAKEEEEIERRNREMATERYAEDMRAAAAEKEKEKQLQREAARRDQERLRKQEEFRLATERIQLEHQLVMQQRQAEMDQKDLERQQLLEAQRREKAAINYEQREKAQVRLQSALETGRLIMQKKRDDYDKKQREAAEKQRLKEERWQKEEALRKVREQAREQQRQTVFQEAQNEQERRVQSLLAKAREAEEVLQRVQEQKRLDMARKSLERQMSAEEKKNRAESMKRMQAFHRKQMLERIQNETERARGLLDARTALQQRRKEANVEASLQRQALLHQMEKLQITKKWAQMAESVGLPVDASSFISPSSERLRRAEPREMASRSTARAITSPFRARSAGQ